MNKSKMRDSVKGLAKIQYYNINLSVNAVKYSEICDGMQKLRLATVFTSKTVLAFC